MQNDNPHRFLSPRQVAEAIGVSESSMKRWADQGLLRIARTAGGHRRLPISEVVQFVRRRGMTLAEPGLLGLPEGLKTVQNPREGVTESLREGREQQLRCLVVGSYLDGMSVAEIGDEMIRPAFAELGDAWAHDTLEVYQERRAIQLTFSVIHELRAIVPEVPINAPTALGATLAGDPYGIAIAMAEVALRESGWRASSLGVGIPADSIAVALAESRPSLLWLGVGAIPDLEEFLAGYQNLYGVCRRQMTAVAVGGRALDENVRKRMKYTAFCDRLAHLTELAETLSGQRGASFSP